MSEEILRARELGDLPTPEPWEKTAAAAIHLVSIPAPLWGPLIAGMVMKGRSLYAETHAWKALKEYIFLSLALFLYGCFSLVWTGIRLYQAWQNGWENLNLWEFVIKFAVVNIALAIVGGIFTVLSVIQAYKAWQGAWPRSEIKKRQKALRKLQP